MLHCSICLHGMVTDSVLYHNFCYVVNEIVCWTTFSKVHINQNLKCYPGPLIAQKYVQKIISVFYVVLYLVKICTNQNLKLFSCPLIGLKNVFKKI